MRKTGFLLIALLIFSFGTGAQAQEPREELSDLLYTDEELAKSGCNYHVRPTTPDSAKALISRFKKCDPLGDYFTLAGKIRGSQYGYQDDNEYPEEHKSIIKLKNLQVASRKFGWVDDSFRGLPMLDRRAVAEVAMPLLADLMVDYFHEEHLQEWLLALKWDEDIKSVEPSWYKEVDWPSDRSKPTQINGFDEKLSKIDLWVRLWWLRRGEGLFTRAKEAVSERVEKQSEG
jgi:hypothetical protein